MIIIPQINLLLHVLIPDKEEAEENSYFFNHSEFLNLIAQNSTLYDDGIHFHV